MFISFDPGGGGNPLAKIAAFIASVLILTVALMFSFVFFSVLAVAGVAAWIYLLWKTRAIRKRAREWVEAQKNTFENAQWPPESRDPGSRVIDGEAREVPDDPSVP
ncbi:MAG: hypothetical protein LBD67_00645 [Candidatus Accumulibacter sp.]|jgi:threonine/homoserine/homoserine lactone efflux protein|nr:hypothetical protein [Accumulibacter sp.]